MPSSRTRRAPEICTISLRNAPSTRPTYFTARVLAQGLDAYNRTLREVCTATGVECFDAATALPKDLAVMYDDVHFTDEGSRRLGEALARHLLRGAPYAK